MATKTIDRSPPTVPSKSRDYRTDLFGWVEDQVAHLNAGRISDIDIVNIADELVDAGKDQYDRLESAIRIVLVRLLKWDHQLSHRSKSWVFSIRTQRRQIDRVLKKSPSLKPLIAEAVVEGYMDARDEAESETGLPAATFPVDCPYYWNTILMRAIEFEGVRSPES